MKLGADHFEPFHRAVHGGRAPFDWQERLLREIVQKRAWPRVLDLPTGAGKTTCIDIALFALALDSDEPVARWCPRRIAMVVDRRVVVDQVAERGRLLLRALASPENVVVRAVAERLRSLSKEARDPIGVYTLRGGMPKDDGWARTPDHPLVIASTVDQLGSRLLIQGYGVSRGMKPVHAGLLGNDTLVLLDEVHLSQPFAETLDQLDSLSRPSSPRSIVRRFHHAFLSATPGTGESKTFQLTDDEKKRDSPLGPRLHASKRVRVLKQADRTAVEGACVEHARHLLERHGVVAVVMNRVASAATVERQLRKVLSDVVDVVLLTGRMRPLDRDDAMRSLRPRIMAGRVRNSLERKLVLVGTQCIEAGADFDFDAMVTEAASLDALRQRFGRVDRLGQYGKAEGIIVGDKGAKDDPVYGEAIVATLDWLERQVGKKREIDFGVLALPSPSTEERESLLAPKAQAPVLLPAYLDLWTQTSPEPAVVPDVSLFLHGPRSGPADVQIVWRADLSEDDLAAARSICDAARPIEIASSVRPSSLEAVSVPFSVAKQWLAGVAPSEMADVEGIAVGGQEEERSKFLALRWRGDESSVISVEELRPGDTIIVPAARGGIRAGCFDPGSTAPASDLAERAALFARGRPALRLHPAVLANWGLSLPTDEAFDARDALELLAVDAEPGWRMLWFKALARSHRASVVNGSEPWMVLEGRRVSNESLRAILCDNESFEDGVELTTDDDDSFHAGNPVSLAQHSGDVERFARIYAAAAGLPPRTVEDIALAGWLHDIGKADRRFQIMLRGGSEIDFYKDEALWAKSGMPPEAKAAHRLAQKRSGYPRGARHEVQSLAMIEKNIESVRAKAVDLDLVLHLVGSHHGYCRPFVPGGDEPQPVEVAIANHRSDTFGSIAFSPTTSNHGLHRLDSPLADRFWRLVGRYGWLELCWLEAILRLADHRASEEEQDGGGA